MERYLPLNKRIYLSLQKENKRLITLLFDIEYKQSRNSDVEGDFDINFKSRNLNDFRFIGKIADLITIDLFNFINFSSEHDLIDQEVLCSEEEFERTHFTNLSILKTLGKWKDLKTLIIENNHIYFSDFPDTLKNLEQLTIIGQPNVLNDNIGKLKNLKFLTLVANHLTVFPEWIQNLTKLEILSLDQNEIEEIPNWINDLKYLTRLYIGDNKIKKIPLLANLTYLSLRYNKCSFNFLPEMENIIIK